MDFAAQVKATVDIVEVVREYVQLRKAGTRWVGLCPFHSEKTPSFGVHPVHQFFKCFGCGKGGDVINFLMEIEGQTFWEALRNLAERHGIPIPRQARYGDDETKLRGGLHEMHDLAGRLFRRALESPAGATARDYLARRGVAPRVAEEFGLGFAERGGQLLARAFEREGFPADQMEASGLILRRQEGGGFFDRFRGRLMFPIHNESGKVIAFAGRALADEDEPKYLNSPETPIYRKSYVLYNLHRARKTIREEQRCILVEGYMDVIGLDAAGVAGAVASCGTALTSHQVRALRRHSDRIVVNFDPDAAGASAAERSVQILLDEGMRIRVLELEGGLDPDEYVRAHGAEVYRKRLAQAPAYFHWLADRARRRFDMSTAEGRVEGMREVLMPAIRRIPDKLEQAAVAEEVATYLRVDPALVRSEFRKAAAGKPRESSPPAGPAIDPKEKLLINVLLASEVARREALPRLAGLEPVQAFRTWPLLRAMMQLGSSGDRWSYADLEARLGEDERTLLASVVFADAMGEQDALLEQALAFLPELERKQRESRVAELRRLIQAAEQAGDLAEAMRLMENLTRASGA